MSTGVTQNQFLSGSSFSLIKRGRRDSRHELLLEAVELFVAVAIVVVDADGHVLGDAGVDGGADEEAGQAQVQLIQRVAPRSAHAALVRFHLTIIIKSTVSPLVRFTGVRYFENTVFWYYGLLMQNRHSINITSCVRRLLTWTECTREESFTILLYVFKIL